MLVSGGEVRKNHDLSEIDENPLSRANSKDGWHCCCPWCRFPHWLDLLIITIPPLLAFVAFEMTMDLLSRLILPLYLFWSQGMLSFVGCFQHPLIYHWLTVDWLLPSLLPLPPHFKTSQCRTTTTSLKSNFTFLLFSPIVV